MNWKTIIWSAMLGLALLACHSRKADYSEFEQFYDKFMEDATFQRQHIGFPMEGVPDNAAAYPGDLQNFRWTAENWRIHRPIDFNQTKLQRQFEPLGDELIIENIVDPSSGYGMVRRWAKIGGEWSLIYYAGMNPLQQK